MLCLLSIITLQLNIGKTACDSNKRGVEKYLLHIDLERKQWEDEHMEGELWEFENME